MGEGNIQIRAKCDPRRGNYRSEEESAFTGRVRQRQCQLSNSTFKFQSRAVTTYSASTNQGVPYVRCPLLNAKSLIGVLSTRKSARTGSRETHFINTFP